jgi:hypothetical protein
MTSRQLPLAAGRWILSALSRNWKTWKRGASTMATSPAASLSSIEATLDVTTLSTEEMRHA